ncbi:NADPH oxidase 5 isoform X2 [Parasteatoda tepidariorum]|nr:NADPH oxidase 5 [Parasteatoda tepidariorum]XP_015925087.1 NADPH oxidase 5 [Parasteatoda tepidariorum]
MELIANLEKTKPSEGLTPDNLRYLEEIFNNAVGNNKEVDFESFKNIVQSKNVFFVKRIFHIFDADKSGTVSLEEFMSVIKSFANQTPSEKLHYLFQVYDINGDGTIQFNELRNVISECMKENGLKFQECEVDELTRMLFEDADADGSGSITFTEFKNQVEKHPGFMENLTQSIERWFLPPMKPKEKQSFSCSCFPRRIKWLHIRNNLTSVTFLLMFFLLNVTLFTSRACHYWDTNIYVILARACGQCLNFNCAFIVFLILRQTLTWLRAHGFSEYFPIDQHLYYHKLTGCVIVFYSVLHTVMHVINFYNMSVQSESKDEESIPFLQFLTSTHLNIGWIGGAACITGWILILILIIMFISSMPFVRRNGKFEVFYYLHQLSFVFWMCLILHAPHFWKWFLAPALLFLVEIVTRISRHLSSNKVAYVQHGILLPSKVTQLVIKRPPKFDYRPGDYVYINIPAIATYEWHPFTISSAPELDDVIWLHVRGVGEWTNSLYNYFDRTEKEAVLSDELAKNLEVECQSQVGSEQLNCFRDSTTSDVLAGTDRNCSALSYLKINDATFICTPEPEQKIIHRENALISSSSDILDDTFVNPSFVSEDDANQTVIEMELGKGRQQNNSNKDSVSSLSINSNVDLVWRRTSFTSNSTSRAIQKKNREDIRSYMAEQSINISRPDTTTNRSSSRLSVKGFPKSKRKSVRVSIAKKGLRRCQTVIVMPTVAEDEEEEPKMDLDKDVLPTEEEIKDLNREIEFENVIVKQEPLKIYLDGPYGSPSRHIFHAKHAVLIGTGIGVTPFASILQSIMYQYRKSRHTCPNCNHKWSDPLPVSNMHLKKVDFFWLNRHQRAFEWFVNLLSELEIEQAQLEEKDRFLDIHMYITSALHRTDMKAVGLQMALDLLYKKEKRDLITGLKSRTQPGRPDWNKVFSSIAEQQKGKVTVFFCGPNQLAKTLQTKCDEFGFRFRKEIF